MSDVVAPATDEAPAAARKRREGPTVTRTALMSALIAGGVEGLRKTVATFGAEISQQAFRGLINDMQDGQEGKTELVAMYGEFYPQRAGVAAGANHFAARDHLKVAKNGGVSLSVNPLGGIPGKTVKKVLIAAGESLSVTGPAFVISLD